MNQIQKIEAQINKLIAKHKFSSGHTWKDYVPDLESLLVLCKGEKPEYQCCPICQGFGMIKNVSPFGLATSAASLVNCPTCNGQRIIARPSVEPESKESQEEPAPITTEVGTWLTYTGKNGYASDLNHANKYLKVGNNYLLSRKIIHNWQTDFFFTDYPDVSFNSVHFVITRKTK